MELLLHPPEHSIRYAPDPRGALSSVGHGAAFRAFARAARRAGLRFMVIGGTYRDAIVRPGSTRDIDIVLIDRKALPAQVMRDAGFTRDPDSAHAWRYTSRDRAVELQVAAIASSEKPEGPFSIAYREARIAKIEGVKVSVPRVDDYVILKVLSAASSFRRRNRDLADIQSVFEAFPQKAKQMLSVAALRGRLRDTYGIRGQHLKNLIALLRNVPRQ